MAILLGCLAMSHAPQLMLDPDQWHLLKNREHEPLPAQPELEKETREVRRAKWNNCFAAIGKLQARLAELRPDVIILVGDDQHENLVDDAMPPFTIFIGSEAEASTSLRYLNHRTRKIGSNTGSIKNSPRAWYRVCWIKALIRLIQNGLAIAAGSAMRSLACLNF